MATRGSTEHHLSTEFRSDLRFFAFFVANGSLFSGGRWGSYDYEYIPLLLRKNHVFGRLFAIFVNVWHSCSIVERANREARFTPSYRAEQYLMRHVDPASELTPEFESWELDTDASVLPWKQCIKEFSMMLGDGKLGPDVLGDIDYVPELFNCGSTLEEVFAVFSNVLMIDENGTPINAEHAFYRAAQCVRQWSVPEYEVEPRFAGWEMELH